MRRLSIALVSVLLVVGLAPAQAQAPVSTPAALAATGIDPAPCPENTFPPELDVDCGYLQVPENRRHPNARQIRLAVAVVHTPSPSPGAEPILVMPGGPSVSAITPFYTDWYFGDTTWDDGHDVVLLDLRGVGLSKPNLGCPELDRANVRHFYAEPYIGSHGVRILGGALEACRRRLVRHDIDPASYSVHEMVGDLEDLRRALDVPQWNLLAVSAGGHLALSYLREQPKSVRSLIDDSGLTTQYRGFLDYERGRHRELKGILAGCRANDACRAKYPHVGRAFMRLVRRLNERPQIISFPKYRPHPVKLRLDGAGLYVDTLNYIYPGDRNFPPDIPGMLDVMWRVSHGQLVRHYRQEFGRGPATVEPESDFVAVGATMSWECRAITNFISLRDRREAARAVPPFAPRFLQPDFDLADAFGVVRSPAGCRSWRVGRDPAWQNLPVKSSVPALVLAGGMDNGVPRYMVRQAVPGLSRSMYVEFPASGHLQLAGFNVASDCARGIAGDFLAHPRQELDTSCVADFPEFDYTPPPEQGRPGVERFGGFGRWRLGLDRYDQMGW